MTLLDRLRGRPPVATIIEQPIGPLVRLEPKGKLAEIKAIDGGPWLNSLQSGPMLNSLTNTPQRRAAAFLRAYKVGWFYKAERKIATDIAMLRKTVSQEVDGDNEAEIIEPDLRTDFDALDPIGQFLRLMERPNPSYTGRTLFTKTQIRIDMAGWAFWYLENGAGAGLPSAIYGISPSRMWPSLDGKGNLLGWIMDKDAPSGGVPFDVDEILPFIATTADDDIWTGQGIVEAVQANVPLAELMAKHTADLLSTGGRLAGMMWPKDRSLGEHEFQDAIRAWRNVASDPNAARRLLIFPEPMEYANGASTPAEIGIPDLAALDRDTILSAFPMWPEILGVPLPAGLNASGESRKEIVRAYHAESLHPRVELLEEVIQIGLLSRYEQVIGGSWDFDIEEPNLDDAASLIEKAGAFKALVGIGFDAKEAVSAVGLDGIKWNGLPQLLDPAFQAQAQQQAAQAQQEALTAGVQDSSRRGLSETVAQPVAKSRDRVTREALSVGKNDVERFLTEQQSRLTSRIASTLPQTKAARKEAISDAWWDGPAEDKELASALRALYLEVGKGGLQAVANQLNRFVYSPQVKNILGDLLNYGGDRITEINEKTHQAVKAQITEGARRGYSIPQITEGVPAEAYAGVQGALLDNGVAAFDTYRAEMIARTETMLSYNRAAITGYDSFGVKEVQAIDGDGDEECAARDGQTFSVEDAYGIADHPNGTLDWIPVLDKAAHQDIKVSPVFNLTIPPTVVKSPDITNVIDVSEIEVHTQPSVVNVTTPAVTVKNDVQTPVVQVRNDVQTPSVTVEAPVVNVAAAKTPISVTVPAELRITSMPDRVTSRKVKREAGLITETVEVETDG